MKRIRTEVFIAAPPESCFDAARSVELHVQSARHTNERIVGGITSGLLKLGDEIEFQAKHFGVRIRLRAKVTEYDRPRQFRDEQLRGPFRRLSHLHAFDPDQDGTRMVDILEFEAPFGWLGLAVEPVLAKHLEAFLTLRGKKLKEFVEQERGEQVRNT